METIKKKREQLLKVLTVLREIIEYFNKISEEQKKPISFMDYDEAYRIFRDSLVQRFEFCSDLFWKYLKKYLEVVAGLVEFNAPMPVIRKAFSVGILSDEEAEKALTMIKDRNLTSHIYKEKVAEHLAEKIPGYYQMMHAIAQRAEVKIVPK